MTTPRILARSAGAGLLALIAGCAGTHDHATAPGVPASPVFSEARYRAHVERLASDEFEGRAPRSTGEARTIEYIEQEFRKAGLEPGVGGSYLQPVPVVKITTHADATMDLRARGGSFGLRYADDMVVWTRRPQPESRLEDAEVVFAGYGIVAPEYGWDDYAGLDVRGKIVLVLVNDPGFATQDATLFSGNTMTYYGRWTYKFEEAFRQGAAGLFVIHETAPAAYPWAVVRNGAAQPQFDLVLEDPASQRLALEGWVTHEAAGRMLALAGEDYEALKAAAAKHGFRGRSLGVTASVGVRNDVERGQSYNVVGMVRGSERPDEVFVYTAHWDHLGTLPAAEDGADAIFNGASDNATGIAALIEIGRAFAETRPRPQRSLMFVAVTAEESGLLGSEHFAANPPVPVAQMAGGLNMDNLSPLGEARDLVVIGYDASELDDYLRRAATKQDRVLAREPTPEKGLYYRSDHFNLAKQGVPMIYPKAGVDLRQGGVEAGRAWLDDYVAKHYHKPSDEYGPAWDVSGTLQDLAVFYDVGLAVANSDEWPNWRAGNEFRAIRDRSRAAVAR
jgi:Zn-dependent M28 family amino/carboxypeptidase